MIELFSETPDERSEARNRCNTLEIPKNELRNALQLLLSSELGAFEADLRENWEISKDFPYVLYKENTRIFPYFPDFMSFRLQMHLARS